MAQKAVVDIEINVLEKNAQKKIEKVQAGLATLSGLKAEIKADVVGGDVAAKRLDELIDRFSKVRKIGGQKIDISNLIDIQNIGPLIDNALKTATGKAKTQLKELSDARNELLRGWQVRVDRALANRSVSSTVNKRQAVSRAANENREWRIRDIESNLATARQTGDLRAQISLLKQKRDLLQSINRANRNNVHDGEIAKLDKEIKALNEKRIAIRNSSKALREQGDIFSNLKNMAARYFSIYTVARFGEKVAETTGYFQQQQVALEGILGSASDAQRVLNDIKSFALQSPFQTKELVTFTKQLAAFGVGKNDIFPTVKKLADISAGLGVDMNRIILAYGQVKSAAVLRGQELRQFTEAGIPMVQALADKFTQLNGRLVTTGEVFKLISERQVPFEMVAEVLSDMTAEGGKFYKMQENITDTMYGQIQKLRDMWTLEMERLGKSSKGFFMGIIKMLQGVIQHGKTLAATLSAVFAVSKISKFITHFQAFVRLMRTAVATTGGWGTVLSIAAGAIAGIWSSWSDNANKVKNAMKEIDSSFAKETSKMLNGFDKLVDKLQSQSTNFGSKAFNEAMSALKSNYGDYLNDDMIDALVNQKKGWEDIANSIREAIKEVQNYNNALARSNKAADIVRGDLEKERSFGLYRGMGRITRDVLYEDPSFMTKVNGSYSYTNDFSSLLANQDKASEYMTMAFDNLMNSGGTTQSELRDEIQKLYMVDENLRRILIEHADEYFKRVEKMEGWNKYVENLHQAEQSPQHVIKRNIDNALKTANSAYEGLWENLTNDKKSSLTYTSPSSIGAEYNPLEWNRQKQEGIIQAAYETAQQFLFGDEASRKKLEGMFSDLEGKSTAERVKGVADALASLGDTLSNGVIKERITMLNNAFKENAQIETGETLQVNERIRGRISASSEGQMKDFYMKYMASDATYRQMVDKVISDRDNHQRYLDTHKRDTGAHADEYDRVQEEKKWLDDLFSYVYALREKPKGGFGCGEYDIEISEFVSRLKDAYEVYKKATQAEGADMGLAYMRGDSKMIERFANFFNGGEGKNNFDIFRNDKGEDIKIGKSGKTIREILGQEGVFIEEGLEAGVINFEEAMRRIGQAMIEYGKQNEKARRGFISAGKAYIKYADQISKDNVAAWIEETDKQFQDLGKTFQRTNQQVEAYRQLMRSGTAFALGDYTGTNRNAAMTPDSIRNATNIKRMMNLYNQLVTEQAEKAGSGIAPKLLSIESLNTVGDIQNAISMVSERMKLNNGNFGVGAYGEAGKELEGMLKNQLNIIIKELQSISSEQYTGDNLADALANAQTKVRTAIDITRSQEKINALYGGDRGAAMKGRLDAVYAGVQSIFDQFLQSNNFEAMSQATRFFQNKDGSQSDTAIWGAAGIDIKALKDKFQKIVDQVDDNILKDELTRKFRDLELKVLEFNAAGGDLGAIGDNINLYKGAHQEALNRYNSTIEERDRHEENISGLESSLANAKAMGMDKDTIDGINLAIQKEKEELAACNTELVKMGENGINFEKSLKGEALKNIQANLNKASQGLDAMQNAVMGVVNAAKSMAKAINKTYDVMHDGENPAWMQDMEGFLEDFGEAFEMLIAPIAAIIAMITALAIVSVTAEAMMTPLLIVMLAIIAAAVIVAAIVAAFQQHDRALQRDIENLEKQIEATENAMKNLQAAAERMNGYSRLNTEIQAISKNMEIYIKRLQQAQKEEEKKNTDTDKVDDFKQQAQESLDAFLNSIQDATDAITASVLDWAGSLSEALRSAFQNGENAARAFRNTAIEMVGDIVNKIIEMTVLEPMIESAINGLLGYSLDKNSSNYIGAQDRFKNGDGSINSEKLANYVTGQLSNDNAAGIYEFLRAVESGYGNVIDFINNDLAKPLKEAWAYNSDTSELSGGIQGITEDTARTLEGLANSQLAQLVLIQRSVAVMEGSGFAQVQLSWFADMQNQQRAIRTATEGIRSAIDEMRNGIRPISVQMQ